MIEKVCNTEGCENPRLKNRWKCRACWNAYMRAYRKENPRTQARRAYDREYARQYYEKNRDRILVDQKQWRDANRDIIREMQKNWRQENEGRTYVDTSSGYVMYVGFDHPIANESGLSRYHRIVLWDKLGGRDEKCHWCGMQLYWSKSYPKHLDALVVDHVNGIKDDNRPENLVPSCNSCNSKRAERRGPVPIVSTEKCSIEYCDRQAASRFNGSKEFYCRVHYNQLYRGVGPFPIVEKQRGEILDNLKECTVCKRYKPWDDFYIRNGRPKGACKPCEIRRITEAKERRLAGDTK